MAVIRLARVGAAVERIVPERVEVAAAEPLVFRIDAAGTRFRGQISLPIGNLVKRRVIEGSTEKTLDFAVTGLPPGTHELAFDVSSEGGRVGGSVHVTAV